MTPSRRAASAFPVTAVLLAAIALAACASGPPPFKPPEEHDAPTRTLLALVLLSEAHLPDPTRVVRAFEHFAKRPVDEAFEPGPQEESTIAVALEGVGTGYVALMPFTIPDREAEGAADFSAQRLGAEDRPLAPHAAHLVVTLALDDAGTAAQDLSVFTAFVAAVTEASASVGVYWGSGGVAHDRQFFLERAADDELASLVLLWFGVTIADESDGRLSFMSHGMQQLDQPEILVGARKEAAGDAAETFFGILAYLADYGRAFGDGDTVGFDDSTHWKVHYVPSPTEPGVQACRIDLP